MSSQPNKISSIKAKRSPKLIKEKQEQLPVMTLLFLNKLCHRCSIKISDFYALLYTINWLFGLKTFHSKQKCK